MNQQNTFVKNLLRNGFSLSWCHDSILRFDLKIHIGSFINQFSALIFHLFLMIGKQFYVSGCLTCFTNINSLIVSIREVGGILFPCYK